MKDWHVLFLSVICLLLGIIVLWGSIDSENNKKEKFIEQCLLDGKYTSFDCEYMWEGIK
jgi:hypothetical protein